VIVERASKTPLPFVTKSFTSCRYNQLCEKLAQAEDDLRRLRDPLQLNLPIEPIRRKDDV